MLFHCNKHIPGQSAETKTAFFMPSTASGSASEALVEQRTSASLPLPNHGNDAENPSAAGVKIAGKGKGQLCKQGGLVRS